MTKIIKTIAVATIAGAAMAVSVSRVEAKTPSHDDTAKAPAHEQIERGYTPGIDIDRGWNPAEPVTARSTHGQDVDRGYTPDTERGANPAQFDVARGGSPKTFA